MATQPRHLDSLLAFLDPLLCRTPLFIEPHHRTAVRLQVGHDEATRAGPILRGGTPPLLIPRSRRAFRGRWSRRRFKLSVNETFELEQGRASRVNGVHRGGLSFRDHHRRTRHGGDPRHPRSSAPWFSRRGLRQSRRVLCARCIDWALAHYLASTGIVVMTLPAARIPSALICPPLGAWNSTVPRLPAVAGKPCVGSVSMKDAWPLVASWTEPV